MEFYLHCEKSVFYLAYNSFHSALDHWKTVVVVRQMEPRGRVFEQELTVARVLHAYR